MTKKDIINEISRRTGIINEAVYAVFEESINIMAEALSEGEPVYIRGLFTLSTVKRAKKYTRNICKGTGIISPAHYSPHAKFSKKLCDKVRNLPIENI